MATSVFAEMLESLRAFDAAHPQNPKFTMKYQAYTYIRLVIPTKN
jgi:hypothetical protein